MTIARRLDDTLRAVRLNATGLGAGDGTEGGKNQRERSRAGNEAQPSGDKEEGW